MEDPIIDEVEEFMSDKSWALYPIIFRPDNIPKTHKMLVDIRDKLEQLSGENKFKYLRSVNRNIDIVDEFSRCDDLFIDDLPPYEEKLYETRNKRSSKRRKYRSASL